MASNFVTLDDLKQNAKEAIDGLEVARCKHLLDEFVDTYDTGSSPDLASLEMLLTLVAFPELEDERAELVVRLHLLDFYRVGLSFEDALVTRYIFSGETEKNKQREIIKEAILQNEEKIGPTGVSQWLKNFDKMESPEKRNEDSIRRFLSKEPMISQLSSQESELLRSILLIYERLIATEIISVDDVIGYHLAIDGKRSDENSIVQSNFTSKPNPSSNTGIVIRSPLLKALSEYPRLGDQNITANRIKTKQSPEPMRGSLTNWIHYYRDELGIGFHDQVLRGKFLFQSENGKKLTNEEREHLNLILKSIEEEFPLEIDTDRQVILFPRVQAQGVGEPREGVRAAAPQPTPQPVSWAIPKPSPAFTFGKPGVVSPRINPAPRPAAAVPRPSLGETDMKPTANIADATLHFSTGHVLPAEKATLASQPAPAASPTASNPAASTSAGSGQRIVPQPIPNRSPYSIRPLRPRE